MPDETVLRLMQKIQWLSLDVDGVLTDGRLYYDASGKEALKAFHVRDGQALKLWHQLGFRSLIISGRGGVAVQKRAAELGIQPVFMNIENKLSCLQDFCKQQSIHLQHIAHIGDDLADIPLIKATGLGIAVADGHTEAQEKADFVTATAGGLGVVSEVVQQILHAQGMWEGLFEPDQGAT